MDWRVCLERCSSVARHKDAGHSLRRAPPEDRTPSGDPGEARVDGKKGSVGTNQKRFIA